MTDPETIPTAKIREALVAAFPETLTTETTIDEMLATVSKAFAHLSTITAIVFAGFARIDGARAFGRMPEPGDPEGTRSADGERQASAAARSS